jgi:hypothetical protein
MFALVATALVSARVAPSPAIVRLMRASGTAPECRARRRRSAQGARRSPGPRETRRRSHRDRKAADLGKTDAVSVERDYLFEALRAPGDTQLHRSVLLPQPRPSAVNGTAGSHSACAEPVRPPNRPTNAARTQPAPRPSVPDVELPPVARNPAAMHSSTEPPRARVSHEAHVTQRFATRQSSVDNGRARVSPHPLVTTP